MVDFRVTPHTSGYFYDYVYGYQKEQETLDSGHVSLDTTLWQAVTDIFRADRRKEHIPPKCW